MMVGYMRVSTTDQTAGYEAQERDLSAAGCTKVFGERISSVAHRAALGAALDYIREGDVLVVTRLDCLARSMRDLLSIVDQIDEKGASLRILAMNLDTSTSTGRLMLNVLGSVAEFERDVMLDRQREGIAKAKTEGKYKGRAPTARAKAEEVRQLISNGVGVVAVGEMLNISRSSVWRIAKASN